MLVHFRGVHFVKVLALSPLMGVQKVAMGVHFIKIAVLCHENSPENVGFKPFSIFFVPMLFVWWKVWLICELKIPDVCDIIL